MKRALADVLWDAANKHLSVDQWDTRTSAEYSCWAVEHALGLVHTVTKPRAPYLDALEFLQKLGCRVSEEATFSVTRGGKRQGVRYMWLLIAMHVAADEGIEVDV